MKLIWAGLADQQYYAYIAKFCIPSWTKLPGEKYIIHDSDKIRIDGINIINWDIVPNMNSKFLERCVRYKPLNFWRKMQSQVWSVRNLNHCDFLILLDTDIEVLDFDEETFTEEMNNFKNSGCVWATGRSQSRHHDSGFIVLNMQHPGLDEVINYYENIWESGKIMTLKKIYDGHAVESMLDTHPSYKIMNTDYGKGLHVYDLGFVHYGSKLPKELRAGSIDPGKDLVADYVKNIIVKNYKN